MIPSIYIIGAPKCGTTSVHNWLIELPQVEGGAEKELRYLMDEGYPLLHRDGGYHKNGLQGYEGHFSCLNADQIAIDSTPDYIYQDTARNFIANKVKDPKVVVLLRKPSDRIYSLFRFAQNNTSALELDWTFEAFIEALNAGNPKPFGDRHLLNEAYDQTDYVKHLSQWFEVLPKEQFFIRTYEEMVADNAGYMKELCDWLGLDGSMFAEYDFTARNVSYQVKSVGLNKFARSIGGRMPDKFKGQLLRKIYAKLNTSPASKAQRPSAELMESINDRYDVSELETLIGRPVRKWWK